jgi:hypothetical protein
MSRLLKIGGIVFLLSMLASSACAVEQVWIQEGTTLWKMDTNGQRVIKRPLGDTFGNAPLLLFDAGYEVIWAVGNGKFGVYDLRESEVKATVLLEKVSRGIQNFEVAFLDWDGAVSGSVKELQYGELSLFVAVVGGMVQTRVDQVRIGDDISATKRLKWLGDAWVKANEKREKKGNGGMALFSKEGKAKLSMGYQTCQEAGWCGRQIPFVGKGVHLVVTEAECNDGCYMGCHVQNSRGEMSQPPNMKDFTSAAGVPSGSCRDYFLAADGIHFATRNELCRFQEGVVTCERAPGVVLGWLGGKAILGP